MSCDSTSPLGALACQPHHHPSALLSLFICLYFTMKRPISRDPPAFLESGAEAGLPPADPLGGSTVITATRSSLESLLPHCLSLGVPSFSAGTSEEGPAAHLTITYLTHPFHLLSKGDAFLVTTGAVYHTGCLQTLSASFH